MDGAFPGALPHLRRSPPGQVSGAGAVAGGDKRRTGLLMAALALAFFAAIILKTWLQGR